MKVCIGTEVYSPGRGGSGVYLTVTYICRFYEVLKVAVFTEISNKLLLDSFDSYFLVYSIYFHFVA